MVNKPFKKGGIQPTLSTVYEGPYLLVDNRGAVMAVELGEKEKTVAAHCCKPAAVENKTSAKVQLPLRRCPPGHFTQMQEIHDLQLAMSSSRKRGTRPLCRLGSMAGGSHVVSIDP